MAITLDYTTKIILITTPTTDVTIQELVNAIRDSEDELEHLSYAKVIDAVGKADLGGSVTTAITLTLSSLWQIQFWCGVTLGMIKDGNIVGGVGDEPIKATGCADTILILNQVGGTIAVVGSGVTPQDKIDIIEGVWDEATSGHIIAGTTGEALNDIFSENFGKWILNPSANTMTLYKTDGITILKKFNLGTTTADVENYISRTPV